MSNFVVGFNGALASSNRCRLAIGAAKDEVEHPSAVAVSSLHRCADDGLEDRLMVSSFRRSLHRFADDGLEDRLMASSFRRDPSFPIASTNSKISFSACNTFSSDPTMTHGLCPST